MAATTRHRRVAVAVLFAVAAAVLVVHVRYYLPFVADDSLISLRYADRFLDGHGLTWTDGKRVEGYSNLLWILLVSLLGLFHVDLIVAARALGIACTLVAVGAVIHASYRENAVIGAAFGALALVLTGAVAVWTIGGLEQPLVAALLAVVIAVVFRELSGPTSDRSRTLVMSLCLGLLCLARPDGPVFVAAVVVTLLAARRARPALVALVVPLLFVAAQTGFRLLYYGEWLPNPAHIKILPTAHRLAEGLAYVRGGFAALQPLRAVGLAGIGIMLLRRGTRTRGLLLALMLAGWLPYLVFIGGDIFPAWRHFVPVAVVLAFAFGDFASWGWSQLSGTASRAAMTAVLAAALVVFAGRQFSNMENHRAVTERWEWDGQVVGLLLKEAFGDTEPLLACESAGCLPYWSQLPSLDMLGLNDYHIARRPPRYPDRGWIAHQFGDGAYVLDRAPDLVSFCSPTGSIGACFVGGAEMQEDPRFHRFYTPGYVRGEHPYRVDALLWFRLDSEKVGVRPVDDGFAIPACLFASAGEPVYSRLDTRRRLVLTLAPNDSVEIALAFPEPPDSAYAVVANGDSVAIRLDYTADGARVVLTAADSVEVEEVVVVLRP